MSSRSISGGRTPLPWHQRSAFVAAGLLASLLTLSPAHTLAAATSDAPAPAAGPGSAAGAVAAAGIEAVTAAANAQARSEPAELRVANRVVTTLRATNEFGATPAMRVRGIEERMQAVLQHGGPLVVTTRYVDPYVAVFVDDDLLFRVLPGDVDPESSQSPRSVADAAAVTLQRALQEVRESRDSRTMATALGKTVLATIALAVVLWLALKAAGWLERRWRDYLHRRTARMMPEWGQHIVGPSAIEDLLLLPVRLLKWSVVALLVYEWLAVVLEFFPYTRPWGERLFENLVVALSDLGLGVLHAIPNLLFVALIFLVTRFVVRLVRAFFEGVQSGRVHVPWIDDATARPTGRLVTTLIWLFSFVAAYPYIPGSDSEAFKGIGVFVGLMMSIGASGVVNQAVSGLMLMYTKALRPGEFVQVGETEGTVTSVGFLTTRIETLRNVEVAIPNAVIAGNVTRNFSRLAPRGGVRLGTSVTIGYDTPWRQVQAMLQVAASRTQGLQQDPPPRVLQTALQDFYVEYTLLVTVADPKTKFVVLDELHGHIQDVFNEHGVQIMSPNYEADPAAPKVVPREQWFAAPASAPATEGSAATR